MYETGLQPRLQVLLGLPSMCDTLKLHNMSTVRATNHSPQAELWSGLPQVAEVPALFQRVTRSPGSITSLLEKQQKMATIISRQQELGPVFRQVWPTTHGHKLLLQQESHTEHFVHLPSSASTFSLKQPNRKICGSSALLKYWQCFNNVLPKSSGM